MELFTPKLRTDQTHAAYGERSYADLQFANREYSKSEYGIINCKLLDYSIPQVKKYVGLHFYLISHQGSPTTSMVIYLKT